MRQRTAVFVSALWPVTALPHAGASDGSFIAGLMHPVFGVDRLLAMILVGVVSTMGAQRDIYVIPSAFVVSMAFGAPLGLLTGSQPFVELGIAASLIALGWLTAARVDVLQSPRLVYASVASFGMLHGMAHGSEMGAIAAPYAYALGFLLSTCVLHISGVVIGEVSRSGVARLILRTSSIAASFAGASIALLIVVEASAA